MGMSRPAVESTLFRARRRLTEEYDDIVSGARCLRIQAIIITAAQTPGRARHAPARPPPLALPDLPPRSAGRRAGPQPVHAPARARAGRQASPASCRSRSSTSGAARDRVAAALGARRGARSCRCSPTTSRAAGARPPPAPPCSSPAWAPAPACTRSRCRPRRATGPAEVRSATVAAKPAADRNTRGKVATAPERPAGAAAAASTSDKGSTRERRRDKTAQRERAERDRGAPQRTGHPRAGPRPRRRWQRHPSDAPDSNPAKSEEPKSESSAADRKPASKGGGGGGGASTPAAVPARERHRQPHHRHAQRHRRPDHRRPR